MWSEVDRLEKLRDIKGIVAVDDYTLYVFIVVALFALVLFYLIVRKIMQFKRVPSMKKVAKKELKNLDLNDTKQSAYLISKYAHLFSEESFEYLEKYKYKKEVNEFEQEDVKRIKGFLNEI